MDTYVCKSDYSVCKAAVNNNEYSICYCSREMQLNKRILSIAIQKHPYYHNMASETLKDDKEFVISIVSFHGILLEHVSKRIQEDREVIGIAEYALFEKSCNCTRTNGKKMCI